jgi:hypothetical protein
MSTIRFKALREAPTRKPVQFEESGKNLLFSVQMCSMKGNEAVFDWML